MIVATLPLLGRRPYPLFDLEAPMEFGRFSDPDGADTDLPADPPALTGLNDEFSSNAHSPIL